jgi:hypothetical protein
VKFLKQEFLFKADRGEYYSYVKRDSDTTTECGEKRAPAHLQADRLAGQITQLLQELVLLLQWQVPKKVPKKTAAHIV